MLVGDRPQITSNSGKLSLLPSTGPEMSVCQVAVVVVCGQEGNRRSRVALYTSLWYISVNGLSGVMKRNEQRTNTSAMSMAHFTFLFLLNTIFEQCHFYDYCHLLRMASMELTKAGTMFYQNSQTTNVNTGDSLWIFCTKNYYYWPITVEVV